jgi:SAM-dependent methyltransferase
MHGFDPSRVAVETAERDFPGMNTHHTLSPLEEKTFNVIICSEVIEHTPDFRDILGWLYRHLEIDGLLLLTTQSGKIYQADRYAGHTQHFQRAAVSGYLEQAGFAVIQERSWGFPFYSLQKYVSDLRFDAVRTQFMESKRNWVTKFVFGGCYCLYFIHDLIAAGPQLYFTASKVTSSSTR